MNYSKAVKVVTCLQIKLLKVEFSFTSSVAHEGGERCSVPDLRRAAVFSLPKSLGIIFAPHINENRPTWNVCTEWPILSAVMCIILLGLSEGLRWRSVSPGAYGVARKWFSKCSVVMQQVELFCEVLSWKPSASLPCLTNLSFNDKKLQSRANRYKKIKM